MGVHQNSFSKLNRDLAISKYKSDEYYDARNMHLITHEGLTTGSMETERGTKLNFKFPNLGKVFKLVLNGHGGVTLTVIHEDNSSYTLVVGILPTGSTGDANDVLYANLMSNQNILNDITAGSFQIIKREDSVVIVTLNDLKGLTSQQPALLSITTEVGAINNLTLIGGKSYRDYLILFTTSNIPSETLRVGTITTGQIWKVKYNQVTEQIEGAVNLELVPSEHLFYNNYIDLRIDYKITDIEIEYRSDEFFKVYWVDTYNHIRHINIANNSSLGLNPDQLDMVNDVEFGDINITSINEGGSYKSGMVQYAYNYYNVNGVESRYSPITGFIPLYDSPVYNVNSDIVRQSPEEEVTGKAVTLTLNNLDTRYQVIKVVAIYYPTVDSLGEIRIIEERNIPKSGVITFTDNGQTTLGTVTSLEFLTVGTFLFTPKTLTTKDGILVAGNLDMEDFIVDWDSRAYRYNSEGTEARITHNGSDFVVDPNFESIIDGNTTSIPKDFDCIQNKDRQYSINIPDIHGTLNDDFGYSYNLDGNLGGQGPNVKYQFKIIQPIKEHGTDSTYWYRLNSPKVTETDDANDWTNEYINVIPNTSYANYASPFLLEQAIGYQRDEVYRFGIVLVNSRGLKTTVKWIADIKMPAMYEEDNKTTYFTYNTENKDFQLACRTFDGYSSLNVLGIEFKISNLPAEVVGYEIVRVKRENFDKTIVGQGFLSPTIQNEGVYRPIDRTINADIEEFNTLSSSKLYNFMSPEITLEDELQYSKVSMIAKFPAYGNSYGDPTFSKERGDRNYFVKTTETKTLQTITSIRDIVTKVKLGKSEVDTVYTINNIPYRHYTWTLGAHVGTSAVLNIEDAFNVNLIDDRHGFALANVTKELVSQYNGNTFSDRTSNVYIPCVSFKHVDDSETNLVFGGDTFVSYYDCLRCYRNLNDNGNSHFDMFIFPVETSINLNIREKCYHNTYYSQNGFYLLQENAGTWSDGDTLVQDEDLFTYNLVYSRQLDLVKYYPDALNFTNRNKFDCRITVSEKQLNTINDIDYWTKWVFASYVDVATKYGPINKLDVFKNKLLFAQDDALGIVSMNDRAMTQDQSGNSLLMAKSGVLDYFAYISTTSGTIHRGSWVNTGDSIHFFDVKDFKWYKFSGESVTPISIVTGVASYFRENITGYVKSTDNTLVNYGVHGVYDKDNLRVIMTFLLNDHFAFTLSYNELMDGYESFYDYTPGLYIGFDNKVLSPYNNEVHIHDRGNYAEYYGTVHDSYVTMIVNAEYDLAKIFNNIEFNTECKSILHTDIFDETVSGIRVWNDYQNSGFISLVPDDNIRRRMRQWWTLFPRSLDGSRMRGQHSFLQLFFDNTNNRRFVLHPVNTFFI